MGADEDAAEGPPSPPGPSPCARTAPAQRPPVTRLTPSFSKCRFRPASCWDRGEIDCRDERSDAAERQARGRHLGAGPPLRADAIVSEHVDSIEPVIPGTAPLGQRGALVGVCVGRRRMGGKLAFVDLVPVDRPATPAPLSSPKVSGLPGAREYEPRDTPLTVEELVDGNHLFTVILTEGDGYLSPPDFTALCTALGDPAAITKPRIGDIFAVRGLWEMECILRGRRVTRMRAEACTLLARGQTTKPGDYADKAWHLDKGSHNARSQRAQRAKAAHRRKHGLSPKSRRARLFAQWVTEIFGAAPHCIDVAGGSGELSRTLGQMGATSVVVDPRGAVDGVPYVASRFDLAHDGVRQACAQADVLLGMHPDGAVNAIVDAACTLRCGFAIVPCCVFPTAYPRVLADGTQVTERAQLCQWILEACRARGWQGPLEHFELAMEGARHGVYGRWVEVGEGHR